MCFLVSECRVSLRPGEYTVNINTSEVQRVGHQVSHQQEATTVTERPGWRMTGLRGGVTIPNDLSSWLQPLQQGELQNEEESLWLFSDLTDFSKFQVFFYPSQKVHPGRILWLTFQWNKGPSFHLRLLLCTYNSFSSITRDSLVQENGISGRDEDKVFSFQFSENMRNILICDFWVFCCLFF